MNYKVLKVLLIIFVQYLPLGLYSQETIGQNHLEYNHESESSLKQEREKWINYMHGDKNDRSWRAVLQEISLAKYKLKKEIIEQRIKAGIKKNQLLSNKLSVGGLDAEWIEKGSNNLAGRIRTAEIDFQRELIYCASDGGNIWRGTLDGKNWTCINNSMNFGNSVRLIKVYNNMEEGINRILAVQQSPSRIWYTDDEGTTWNSYRGFESSFQQIKRAVVTGNGNYLYVLGGNNNLTQVYVSVDFGVRFEKIYESNVSRSYNDIWADEKGSGNIYLIDNNQLSLISSEGELTQINQVSLSDMENRQDYYLRGSCAGGTTKLMLMESGKSINEQTQQLDNSSNFYSFYEGDSKWNYNGTLAYKPFETNSFEISQADNEIIYFGAVNMYRSYWDAIEWELINQWYDYYGDMENLLHADIPGIRSFLNPDGEEILLIGTDGGLYISYDQAETVKNISMEGLNVSQYYDCYTPQNGDKYIYAGAQDQGFQRCLSDTGDIAYFEQPMSGDYGHLSSSDDGEHLWFVYPGFAHLYKKPYNLNPSGYRWNFPDGAWRIWMPPVLADPMEPRQAFVGGTNDDQGYYIWLLKYEGSQIDASVYSPNFSELSGGGQVSAMAIPSTDDNIFYTLTSNGHFFYSVNRGKNFVNTSSPGIGIHWLYGSCILPSDIESGKLYIAGNSNDSASVYISADYGQTFTPLQDGLPKILVHELAQTEDEKYIFAATAAGPYMFVADENKWYDISGLNCPDQQFWSVEYIKDIQTARFSTYGRGIWDFKILGKTDVNEDFRYTETLDLTISPNPAAHHADISFELKEASDLSIRIYDISGKLIVELDNHYFSAGKHFVTWDIDSTVPRGTYTVVVSYRGMSSFKKISVM